MGRGVERWLREGLRAALLSPEIANCLLPHFRLYEVVPLYMSVLPYKYRTTLEMLHTLMEFRELMGRINGEQVCNTTVALRKHAYGASTMNKHSAFVPMRPRL